MSDREVRRRSPIFQRHPMDYYDRSFSRNESPQRSFRDRYGRRISPPRSVHRGYCNTERRDRVLRREFHERRYTERDNPEESRCLGVFGMSKYTKEDTLRDVFLPYGPIEKIKIVYDAKTNISRGYSFIYYKNIEDAIEARKRCNNLEINGKAVRVDFSLTKRAYSPTPGMYMGNLMFHDYDGRDHRTGGDRSSRYDTSYRRDSYRRNEEPERTHSRYQPYFRPHRY